MGFGDKIRRFFSQRGNPALGGLERFVEERKGVEGFIEPRTATNPTSLLLVDRDGDHLRAPLREPEEGAAFCGRLGIPVYDAQVVGYPKRMKDYERRRGRVPSTQDIDERFADLEKRLRESPPEQPEDGS